MNNLSKRFNAWRRRRHLQRVAKWEHTRIHGRGRYLIRVALIWGGAMILSRSLYDYYFFGRIQISGLIYYSIAGPIVGLVSWWINEGEYQAAKIDARVREIPQPHGDA
jgi:hypothetical protein